MEEEGCYWMARVRQLLMDRTKRERRLTIFVELGMALSVAVYVLPGLGVDKGQLVGHGAQDGAVSEV